MHEPNHEIIKSGATDADDAALAAALADQLGASAALPDRVALIATSLRGRTSFSTSLGLEDQVILHAIATAGVPVDVFTLDTGRHFPETLDTLEASERAFGMKIRVVAPDAAELGALVARDGINGFRTSVASRKACCEIRKVRPLQRELAGARGWITGLRRGQSGGRSDIALCEADPALGLVKANPLADWSLAQVEAYIATHAIPVNALHARGFPSIGCQPCTRAIAPGEDLRAGRWWWENLDGKECGLHVRAGAKGAAQ